MKKSMEELRQSPYHQELARKMCAAYIAQQQGVTLDRAIKKVPDAIGDLWFLVAEFARQGCAANTAIDISREPYRRGHGIRGVTAPSPTGTADENGGRREFLRFPVWFLRCLVTLGGT